MIARQQGLPSLPVTATATLHAPQSPSAQPSFVPVRPLRRNSRSVGLGNIGDLDGFAVELKFDCRIHIQLERRSDPRANQHHINTPGRRPALRPIHFRRPIKIFEERAGADFLKREARHQSSSSEIAPQLMPRRKKFNKPGPVAASSNTSPCREASAAFADERLEARRGGFPVR